MVGSLAPVNNYDVKVTLLQECIANFSITLRFSVIVPSVNVISDKKKKTLGNHLTIPDQGGNLRDPIQKKKIINLNIPGWVFRIKVGIFHRINVIQSNDLWNRWIFARI